MNEHLKPEDFPYSKIKQVCNNWLKYLHGIDGWNDITNIKFVPFVDGSSRIDFSLSTLLYYSYYSVDTKYLYDDSTLAVDATAIRNKKRLEIEEERKIEEDIKSSEGFKEIDKLLKPLGRYLSIVSQPYPYNSLH